MSNDLIVKPVNVLGDTIMAAKDTDGVIWIGVRWVCNALGMTEGQIGRQVKNIKKDMVFEKGWSNQIPLPTNGGEQDAFCIRNDFVPIWLTKINITKKTREERPDFAKKLLDYQLKAKDILAAAFLPTQVTLPKTTDDKIALLAQGHTELRADIEEIKAEVNAIKLDLPILPIEADRITEAVRKKGVSVLGGKQSNAYRSRGLRQKVYNCIYANLKYNFSVRSYKSIKRSQTDKAVEIIAEYKPPLFLAEQIEGANSQQTLDLKGGMQ